MQDDVSCICSVSLPVSYPVSYEVSGCLPVQQKTHYVIIYFTIQSSMTLCESQVTLELFDDSQEINLHCQKKKEMYQLAGSSRQVLLSLHVHG